MNMSLVIGPDGDVLTRHDLPQQSLGRWVARRKAEVIAGVHGGLVSLSEALERYSLTNEEFMEWERGYAAYGLRGLRVSLKARKRFSANEPGRVTAEAGIIHESKE